MSRPARHPETLYLSAHDLVRLVRRKGLSACIAGVAARIEADFLRWPAFDKTARVASHSPVGVIELMPIADACSSPSSTSTVTPATRSTACPR